MKFTGSQSPDKHSASVLHAEPNLPILCSLRCLLLIELEEFAEVAEGMTVGLAAEDCGKRADEAIQNVFEGASMLTNPSRQLPHVFAIVLHGSLLSMTQFGDEEQLTLFKKLVTAPAICEIAFGLP